jgi:Encapsulating protein for peroxidase
MSDIGPGLTDDQWNRIRQIVHDEAMRARVAASFLPLYGPVRGETTTVPADTLSFPFVAGQQRLEVDDYTAIRLTTVAANVFVPNHMIADPELTAAGIMFGRAAKIIARVEDAIIFNGRPAGINPPGTGALPQVFTISPPNPYQGLTQLAARLAGIPPGPPVGPTVFTAVVNAINFIEAQAYYKPYACVLADDLFTAVYTPTAGGMVLPADSIPPILEGPLLRSSCLGPGTGLVISLEGNPVEIVVGSEISVRYLQGALSGEHVFRVSERFVLRVKDNRAVVQI